MAGTLSYKTEPLPNYLVDNPIVFELKSTVQELIRVNIFASGSNGYSGTFMPVGSGASFEANISVSEILKSCMKRSEIANLTQPVSLVSNSFVRVWIFFTQNDSILGYDGNIYRGGIGKRMLRYLKEKNTDIFAYKLLNTDRQFFMTTRTSGRHIVVKENELCPLCFIASDRAYTVVTEYGNTFTFPAMTAGDLHALNIDAVRRLSYDSYRKIPSYLGILVDGKFVCDIIIKKPAKSPDSHVIQFLNSFSAFEKLEVTGKAAFEPEFAEDSAFLIYDQGIDDYIEQNSRSGIREVIKADFGYKSLEEFLFMRDMLQSDRRYLIDPDGNRQEVRVSCENFSHDLFPAEPGSVPLKIRFTDSDSNYSPEIDESLPIFKFGEGIWQSGTTNGYGFLLADAPLNTV
jgi:hypothetical protein